MAKHRAARAHPHARLGADQRAAWRSQLAQAQQAMPAGHGGGRRRRKQQRGGR
jgi:hypothetical protein